MLGPGDRAHAHTQGASRWAALWISATDFDRYSQTLTGAPVRALNGASSWRPGGAALRALRELHAAAITMFERRPAEVLAASAVHGLEQQLIHALVECLSDGVPGAHKRGIAKRHGNLMARFEDACATSEHRAPTLIELCETLGVSERYPANILHAASRHGTDELSPPAQTEIGPPRPMLGQPCQLECRGARQTLRLHRTGPVRRKISPVVR